MSSGNECPVITLKVEEERDAEPEVVLVGEKRKLDTLGISLPLDFVRRNPAYPYMSKLEWEKTISENLRLKNENTGADTNSYMFHVTRLSSVANFLREGVQLGYSQPGKDFSHGKAFYCSTSLDFALKFAGRGLNRRHKWVFGLIQRGSHRCVVVPVATRDAATLLPIIRQWVLPGTTIVSDCWAAYGGIAAMQGQNYVHLQVNHRYNFVNPNNPLAHTQGIESMWSNLKRQLHHLQGTSDALFQSYLYLYMWRRAMQQNQNIFGDILYYIREYNPL